MKPGDRVQQANGMSTGTLVRRLPDYVVGPTLDGSSERKRRWIVRWEGAPEGYDEQEALEESVKLAGS